MLPRRLAATPVSRRAVLGAGLVAGVAALAGCGRAFAEPGAPGALRLGYLANLTHAVPILALARGSYQAHLPGVGISTSVFPAGPAAVEALLSGAIDAAYLGPSPAINAYVRTKRQGTRIVAGGATGGAALVVRPDLTSASQLRGRTLATPQLGGTQDVALRTYLLSQGLRTDTTGGDDVTVVAQPNAQTLDLFRQHAIDGAWLPEPWVSRMVLEGGAKVLLDEASLWPRGVFPTTVLVVMQSVLESASGRIAGLLAGHVATVSWARANPALAHPMLNEQLATLTGKALAAPVLARALASLSLGWDPQAHTAIRLAQDAVSAGTSPRRPDLTGLYDLRLLNQVLLAAGQPPVSGAGLEIT